MSSPVGSFRIAVRYFSLFVICIPLNAYLWHIINRDAIDVLSLFMVYYIMIYQIVNILLSHLCMLFLPVTKKYRFQCGSCRPHDRINVIMIRMF